jgi:hypothetical protein
VGGSEARLEHRPPVGTSRLPGLHPLPTAARASFPDVHGKGAVLLIERYSMLAPLVTACRKYRGRPHRRVAELKQVVEDVKQTWPGITARTTPAAARPGRRRT